MARKSLEILNHFIMEYGYINESGYLRTRELQEQRRQYRDGNEIKTRIITIEEQAEELSLKGWKPVDLLDKEQMKAPEGYIVRIIPYDAGERISFRYEQERDMTKIRKEIEDLKAQLTNSDYKIIKCYEASLIGESLPYDITHLHRERQAIRDKINEIENTL